MFDHRIKCWQKWQDAQVTLQKKREAEAKLQLANKPDKLQQAKEEIKEVMLSNMILELRLSALAHSFCIMLLYTIFVYKSLTCCFPYLLKFLKGIYLKHYMCAIFTHCKICKTVNTVSAESGRWKGGREHGQVNAFNC